jgi:hypothetical protein
VEFQTLNSLTEGVSWGQKVDQMHIYWENLSIWVNFPQVKDVDSE